MEPIHLPSDEEIWAACHQGEEAVIAPIHQMVGQLAAHVQALEDRMSKKESRQWQIALQWRADQTGS